MALVGSLSAVTAQMDPEVDRCREAFVTRGAHMRALIGVFAPIVAASGATVLEAFVTERTFNRFVIAVG